MGLTVTPRALEVLRRALAAARLDPSAAGVRVTQARDGTVRTGFALEPEPDERVFATEEIQLFVPESLGDDDVFIDVTPEHDQIVLR